MAFDPIALTQRLVRIDTVNPPGNEQAAMELVAAELETSGFRITFDKLDTGRCSLIADWDGGVGGSPRCFTGHLDTVPIGNADWRHDPFSGLIENGCVYGRGSADMKGGVAAIVVAAIAATADRTIHPLRLIFTAGEETGCDGARQLARRGLVGDASVLIVAEPTQNRVACGHKGVYWLDAKFMGTSSHGSMPHLGKNAVLAAAASLRRLSDMDFLTEEHALLGSSTISVGYLRGGQNINVVPDRATVGIDIRSLPEQSHARIRTEIEAVLGRDVAIEELLDLEAVFTPPEHPWIRLVQEEAAGVGAVPSDVITMPYFTDASILSPAMGYPPVVIFGPGDPAMAHRTNECCPIDQILFATRVFETIMKLNPRVIASY